MSCGGCLRSVTRAVQALDPGATVDADLEARTVEIATAAPREAVEAALAEAGFPPSAG